MPTCLPCAPRALVAGVLLVFACPLSLFAQPGDDPFGDPFDSRPGFAPPADDPFAPEPERDEPSKPKDNRDDVRGQPAPPPRVKPDEQAVAKALEQRIDLEFIETPLEDVLDFLRRASEVNIDFDERSLEEYGIAHDTPITFQAKQLRLKQGLKLLLEPYDLAFDVRDSGICIATTNDIQMRLSTFVYPAGRLVSASEDEELSPATRWTMDDLIDALQSTVAPTQWDEMGGAGSMRGLGNLLTVTNSYAVNQQVRATLQALEAGAQAAEKAGREPPAVVSLPVIDPESDEGKIHAALQKPAKLSVIEIPLQDVVDYLAGTAGIPILINYRALEEVGIGSDTPVTRNLRDVSLNSLLQLMLKEMDLTYVVRDGVVLITTPEEVEGELQVRVFPVLDLVSLDDETLVEGEFEGDYETLIELMTAIVRPTSWDEVGGPGAIEEFRGCLLFAQTEDVFDDVVHLLAGLRKLRAAMKASPDQHVVEPISLGEVMFPRQAKIRERLAADVGMHGFVETPLQDVIDALKKHCGVEIQIDTKALEEVGIGSDQSISTSLGGESLGAALRRILRPLDLTWVLRDEVILITTPEEDESELTTWLYPVGDLLGDDRIGYGRYDEIIETLRAAVASNSWEEVGGPGAIEAFPLARTLVVSQTDEVHEQIAALFTKLRAAQAASQADAPPRPKTAEKIVTNKAGERLELKVYKLKSAQLEDAKAIVETVRELIEPQSWQSDEPYYARAVTGAIIVRHTPKTQRIIGRLLGKLEGLVGMGSTGAGFAIPASSPAAPPTAPTPATP